MLKKFAGVLSDVPRDSNVKEVSLKKLLRGIIEESTSHWSSPVDLILNSLEISGFV